MNNSEPRRPVRIANCSGFFGDRLAAAREQVEGGPIDVLTGDWLAELTMLILARQRLKHGAGAGYARTFLTQMEQVLGTCLDRGIKVVTNAGGLDPDGLAEALRGKAAELGLSPRIAVVTGDDLSARIPELLAAGEEFRNLDTGAALAEAGIQPLTANAYLGGRGISAALQADADVVITGRVTDAAVVVGPAAWWHGWEYGRDLDALAGAVAAGHIIECGAQATGGNYAFFADVPGLEHPGFPIAEVAADGSSVITKHEGTSGLVSVGTITAQLLYEIGGPAYANPDVVARFDSITLSQVGPDRVGVGPVRGEPAPDRLKVSMNYLGGFRNTMTIVLTGLDVEAKADLAARTVTGLGLAQCRAAATATERAAASRLEVAELDVTFVPRDTVDAPTAGQAQAHLHLTVKDPDPRKVGKPFTAPVVESALGSFPGMFPTAPPADGAPFGVFWPTTVAAAAVEQVVTLDGKEIARIPEGGLGGTTAAPLPHERVGPEPVGFDGPARRVPLGSIAGARSGDKGGNANIGVWTPDPAAYPWLLSLLTPTRVEQLLPEAEGLAIDVFALPNLHAVNIVIHGLLGRGVSDSTRLDPQAKGLAEQLRARLVDVPEALL
jgi:hypothetical protein